MNTNCHLNRKWFIAMTMKNALSWKQRISRARHPQSSAKRQSSGKNFFFFFKKVCELVFFFFSRIMFFERPKWMSCWNQHKAKQRGRNKTATKTTNDRERCVGLFKNCLFIKLVSDIVEPNWSVFIDFLIASHDATAPCTQTCNIFEKNRTPNAHTFSKQMWLFRLDELFN